MAKQKKSKEPNEIPLPVEKPEIEPFDIPDIPPLPHEIPDTIPDENPFITTPYEIPPLGEAPETFN
jgi:hypothetical protein